jgi:DNA-binding beta-propeller fold protein YncE
VSTANTIYIADFGNHIIRSLTTSAVSTVIAGFPGVSGFRDGTGTFARFSSPYGVAVSSSGLVFISDQANAAIRVISSAGKFRFCAYADMQSVSGLCGCLGVVTTIAGGFSGVVGFADGYGTAVQFASPSHLSLATNGRLYVADSGNNRVRLLNTTGSPISLFLYTPLFKDGSIFLQVCVRTDLISRARASLVLRDTTNLQSLIAIITIYAKKATTRLQGLPSANPVHFRQ